jgi:hypothetical protein
MMYMLKVGGLPILYKENFPETDERNPFGYYEHPDVMAARWTAIDIPTGTVVKAMSSLYYHDNQPKIEHVIVMRRSIEASAASINARREKHGLPLQDLEYQQGQIDAIRLEVSPYPHIEVWYDDLIRNPANEALRLARFLKRVPGIDDNPLDLAAMAACINPSLRHY